MKLKKIIAGIMALAICMGFIENPVFSENVNSISVGAEEAETHELTTGVLGDNVVYSFDKETGTLTISGEGDMYDFDFNHIHNTAAYFPPFFEEENIKKVIIEEGVTKIGANTFGYSGYYGDEISNIEEIVIPDSIKEIGSGAFEETLWYENQPDGMVYIGNVAYKYKGEMPENTSVEIKDGTISISDCAFYGCKNLTEINIPDSVEKVGFNAFEETLWYENQPDGLIYTGKTAYKYKGEMPENTSVEIKDGTVYILDMAFQSCANLTEVIIPDSVTVIGKWAFEECEKLENVVISDNIRKIGSWAFNGTKWNMNLPAGAYYIGDMLYQYTSDSESEEEIFEIKEGTKYIADSAFSNESNEEWGLSIKKIIIPDSVVEIGERAFGDMESLVELTIPASVKKIGRYAFSYCLDWHVYDFKVYGYKETAAEKYAERNYCEFIALDDEENPPVSSDIGDIDGDGEITSSDALNILQVVTGIIELTDEQKLIADLDGDGEITSSDALKILQIIVGIA